MKRAFLGAVALLALVACGPKAEKAADADTGLAPRLSGRLYTCDLSYIAAHGPLTSQSRATVRMAVDTGPLTPGWKVESVTVTEALADAQGFDPWLPFMAGVERPFFEQRGSVLTLAMSEGAPVTLDTATGDLNWSSAGVLGETEYTGGCY